jgi:hypothetical protein
MFKEKVIDPKNQLTGSIDFAGSTRSISATRNTKPTNFFSILEDIIQQ